VNGFYSWRDEKNIIDYNFFGRYDAADKARTKGDIRELIFAHHAPKYDFHFGIGKEFWGVVESQHLVDVLNQTDLAENVNAEAKLGQPMMKFALKTDWGKFSYYLMSGFRERTFPGVSGRFRTAIPIDTRDVSYESPQKRTQVDHAFRWSKELSLASLAVSHFYGTSRAPDFNLKTSDSGVLSLAPHYPLMQQSGLELQITVGALLVKMEGVVRGNKTFSATTARGIGGVEYTLSEVIGRADIGLLAEYLAEQRRASSVYPFQNDVFLGSRITFNDTGGSNLLLGAIVDRNNKSQIYSLKFSRNLSAVWKFFIESQYFENLNSTDPLAYLRRDSFLKLELTRYFIP